MATPEANDDPVTFYSNLAIAANPYDLRAPLTRVEKTSSLFYTQLPPEIRANIYLHAMEDLEKEFIIKEDPDWKIANITPFTKILPKVCFMDRRTFYEAVLVYLRRSQIVLEDGGGKTLPKLIAFLSRFPRNEGFDAIREVTFLKAFTSYEFKLKSFNELDKITCQYPDALIGRLSGLKTLRLAFTSFRIAHYDACEVDHVYTKEELSSELNLDGLFEHGPRQLLIVRCTDWEIHPDDPTQHGRWMFDNLISLLKEGFAKHNRNVKVEVQWVSPWLNFSTQ
ncbi:hypothetical protein BDV96DRAFT_647718 [Lophiotrema nucula]|uniref:Uncharacterized protein n=1 Tax=Lophiotrema nucula TaxID=690887 RepID=A0A6A5Z4A8_9PLEO|nr:hypothetical protein BDV96DRAFT_647718 [Lophiotrema nucula]